MPISLDIELPAADEHPELARADLTFYGLDHGAASYEARVFFDRTDADEHTPLDDPSYAGSFSVFGHGGCFGEEGHCAVREPVTTFDRRLPHQLVPATRVLICTEQIKGLIAQGKTQVRVTVVAVIRARSAGADDVLHIDEVSLHTYE